MKKIMLMAACVLMAASVSAQNFSYGVKAGLNLSTITDVDNANMKPGFHVGVFGEYTISDFVGVQAELLYSAQGTKLDDYTEEGMSFTKNRMNLDYLNIPILAKLYLLENLSLDLGPQFGFLLSAKTKTTVEGISGSVDIKDQLKSFDLSVPMGLTYKFNMGLEVSARYVLGLTKLADGGDSKNSVIQVGLGYRF